MRICLCSVFVEDQARAMAFYTEVLGFVVSKDVPMGADRWLTLVAPGDAGGTELLLEPMGIPEAKTFQQALYAKGIPATSFASDDIQAEYERLSARGVKFKAPPLKMDWGCSATFDDTCGNWLHLHQV